MSNINGTVKNARSDENCSSGTQGEVFVGENLKKRATLVHLGEYLSVSHDYLPDNSPSSRIRRRIAAF